MIIELEKIFCNPILTKTKFIEKHDKGYSNLYILRKDILWCRGIDPISGKKICDEGGAPFAALILLRILFNYLVWLSGTTFDDFIKKYSPEDLNIDKLNILNRLRNALEHESYQLVWKPDIKRNEIGKITHFAMAENKESQLIEKIDENRDEEYWAVNISKLHSSIENSAINLYEDALKNRELRKKILSLSINHSMHVISKNDFINYSKSRRKLLLKEKSKKSRIN